MKLYTDLEQSKKLAEILPIDSADHHYVRKVTDFMGNPVNGEWSHPKYGNPNSKYANYMVQNFTSYETIPCWSLAGLLDMLNYPTLAHEFCGSEKGKWFLTIEDSEETYRVWENDPMDACYEMILKLHELNLL